MVKAQCLRSCNTYTGIKGASTMSCCGSMFDMGQIYTLELLGGIDINSHGEVELYFSAQVYEGSHDGYDNACGVRFQNVEFFNHYFQVVEEEE